MKKAVAKCHQEDAPELNLPPYRSMYKFVNVMINGADQMNQEKLQQMFFMMKMMNNYEGNDDYDHYQSRNNYHERHSGYEWLQDKWMRYKMQKMIQHVMNEDRDNFSARPYSFDNKMDRFDMVNDNKMNKFQMMKMMKEVMNKNNYNDEMDKYKTTKLMKEFFGNDYKGNKFNSNDFDMMKNFDDKDYKMPVQPRFRFKRQASGNTRPTDLTKPAQDLNRGDRLYAKLEEQKKYMESYVIK